MPQTRILFSLSIPVHLQISQPPIGDHERHMQFIIRERLRGTPPQGGLKSKGALLLELARELRDLRDELEDKRYGNQNKIKSRLYTYLIQSFSLHRS